MKILFNKNIYIYIFSLFEFLEFKICILGFLLFFVGLNVN